jgi:para-aminobenzoate synthetase component 1
MATGPTSFATQSSAGTNAPGESAPWRLLTPHLDRGWHFLLDRAGNGEPSFAGSLPSSVLVINKNGSCTRLDQEGSSTIGGDPIEAIDHYVDSCARTPRAMPAWISPDAPLPRTVGYLAYELGSYIENVPRVDLDPVGAPLAVLATYDRVDAWNPDTGSIETIVFEDTPPVLLEPLRRAESEAYEERGEERDAYTRGFERISSAIAAGDIYQANLSRRITFALESTAADAYERIRRRQPVPHGAYLDLGAWKILSNSPECFLRVDGEIVRTFPIKGTRPRAFERNRDRALARELATDAKERAEHLMIVDLERNDLGRVCRTGTVSVPAFATVASFATVHHMVSEVRGCLEPGCQLADLLRATFPGGSITGAPKIRSMEIIAEVENTARGVYTGAVGFFNGSRSLELAVAIRTAVAVGSMLHYLSGGGIVADSTARQEWDETITKARTFMDVVSTTTSGRKKTG